MTSTPEYGIYTASDGGFVETGLSSKEEADKRLAEYVAEDADNAEDLTVQVVEDEDADEDEDEE